MCACASSTSLQYSLKHRVQQLAARSLPHEAAALEAGSCYSSGWRGGWSRGVCTGLRTEVCDRRSLGRRSGDQRPSGAERVGQQQRPLVATFREGMRSAGRRRTQDSRRGVKGEVHPMIWRASEALGPTRLAAPPPLLHAPIHGSVVRVSCAPVPFTPIRPATRRAPGALGHGGNPSKSKRTMSQGIQTS